MNIPVLHALSRNSYRAWTISWFRRCCWGCSSEDMLLLSEDMLLLSEDMLLLSEDMLLLSEDRYVVVIRGYVVVNRGYVVVIRGYVVVIRGYVLVIRGYVLVIRGYSAKKFRTRHLQHRSYCKPMSVVLNEYWIYHWNINLNYLWNE